MKIVANHLHRFVAHLLLSPTPLQQRNSRRLFAALLLGLLLLGGCGRNRTEPAPSPTATALTAVDIATPIADDAPTPQFQAGELKRLGSDSAETQLVSARFGYTLTLPGGWWLLDLPKNGDEMLVSNVAQQSEFRRLVEAAQQFEVREKGVRTEVVARKGRDASAPVSMTMLILPRHGLSLEQYLAGAVAALKESDAQIEIERSGIDDELRTDGAPIATLQYMHTDSPARSTTYYHAVIFDSSADHLLAITFATPATHFTSELSAMQGIIADMALHR